MDSRPDQDYEWPEWATSNARRFYMEEWQRMDPGTAVDRPPYPYTEIIKTAILKSPQRRLTLSQLYADCSSKFPYFASIGANDSWKNTLRHNLSTQRYFIKLNREVAQPGKGHYWTYDAEVEEASMSSRRRRQVALQQQLAQLQQRQEQRQEPAMPLGQHREEDHVHSEALQQHRFHLSHRMQASSSSHPAMLALDPRSTRSQPRTEPCTPTALVHFRPNDEPADRPSPWFESSHAGRRDRAATSASPSRGRGGGRQLAALPQLQHGGPRPQRSLSDHFLSHPIPTQRFPVAPPPSAAPWRRQSGDKDAAMP